MDRTKSPRAVFLCAGLVALLSQVSVAVQDRGFHLSVAVILLQILLFTLPDLPALPLTVLSAAGVFLLRLINAALLGSPVSDAVSGYAPEILFYLSFGVLFFLFFEKKRPAGYRLSYALPLAAVDALSNLAELLVREGNAAFSPALLLRIAAAGLVRALLAAAILSALRRYGIQILRNEDSVRYQKLLLMTADLRSEVVWMEKGAELAEQTMSRAYQLCRSLRAEEAAAPYADEALMIAKDVHEVKKDYALVMRGISAVLGQEGERGSMELSELFRLLRLSTERFAGESGKDAALTCRCDTDRRTTHYYELMSVFRNLLNNAVEAAPTDRPVHIRLIAQEEGGAVLFSVEDDCGGIPPERMEHIFTPGFSSKIDRRTGEINRGLGLSIVKDLVEQTLKGSVTVRSSDGETAFTVRIPTEHL